MGAVRVQINTNILLHELGLVDITKPDIRVIEVELHGDYVILTLRAESFPCVDYGERPNIITPIIYHEESHVKDWKLEGGYNERH